MVVEYLNQKRNDLLEEKILQESEQNRLKIKLEENLKYTEKLKKEDERDFDAFSPRKQNSDLRERIAILENEYQILLQDLDVKKKLLTSLDSKIGELDSIIKIAKRQRDTYNQYEKDCMEEHDIEKIKILEVQEHERQRIARELHDTSVQNLIGIVHKVELCSKLLKIDPTRCNIELSSMSKLIRETIDEMRKMIYNLHPMSFHDIGFDLIVEREITNVKEKGIHTEFSIEGTPYTLDYVVALTLLRIITEACNNVIKHANATSIFVKIIYEEEFIKIIIKDDGQGFDITKQKNDIREDHSGFGLSSMKERVCLLSGKLSIDSIRMQGTEITIEIPVNGKGEE